MTNETNNSRKLFLLRHGERIDYALGEWISDSFDENGFYTRKNLNMPKTLPTRSDGYNSYSKDSPLTNIGLYQAQLTGEAFKDTLLNIDYVYCSPSFRCVQTCDAFLKGYGKREKIQIKIEPGLFEWLILYKTDIPKWISPQELTLNGFNIDLDYKPYVKVSDLKLHPKETCDEYYSRNWRVTNGVLKKHENGNVLLVAHSTIFEACTRDLIGKKRRNMLDMQDIILPIPYCYFMQVEEKEKSQWEITGRPFVPLTHSATGDYDHHLLLD